MTSISSLNSVTTPPPPPPSGGDNKLRDAYQAAAQTLGVTDDQLRSDLQSGQSLADVAQAQGVSTDTLESAMSSALGTSASSSTGSTASTASTSSTNSVDLTQLINRKGGGGHHHHHHGGGAASATDSTDPTQNNLQSLAGVMGSDPSEFLQQLQSGDLASFLQSDAATWSGASATASFTGGVQVDTLA